MISLQEKDAKIESIYSQVSELKKLSETQVQLEKDIHEEKACVSQLKEQSTNEAAKQKTKLDEACRHYQNTLKEEQTKFEAVFQQLESAKSDQTHMKLEVTQREEALEAQKAIAMELNGQVSGLQKDLADVDSETDRLKKSLDEASHLLSIAQSAPKHYATAPSKLETVSLPPMSTSAMFSEDFLTASLSKEEPTKRLEAVLEETPTHEHGDSDGDGAIAQVVKMQSELVVADRVTIPLHIWVKPDGSVVILDEFIGPTSRHPGVPAGSTRKGPTHRDWSACLQDVQLKPW